MIKEWYVFNIYQGVKRKQWTPKRVTVAKGIKQQRHEYVDKIQ
jgi:hypothetical protein